jgi:hypothetical protein
VPNKATQEIKEFARNILISDSYRRSLVRRIEAGKAPQMEVLLHHYAFGKPKHTYVEPAPARQSALEQALERMTSKEVCEKTICTIREAPIWPAGPDIRPREEAGRERMDPQPPRRTKVLMRPRRTCTGCRSCRSGPWAISLFITARARTAPAAQERPHWDQRISFVGSIHNPHCAIYFRSPSLARTLVPRT